MATTSCPRSRRYNASVEPRNPQPPVIRTFKVSYLRRNVLRLGFGMRRKPQDGIAIREITQRGEIEPQQIKAPCIQVTSDQIEERIPEVNEERMAND